MTLSTGQPDILMLDRELDIVLLDLDLAQTLSVPWQPPAVTIVAVWAKLSWPALPKDDSRSSECSIASAVMEVASMVCETFTYLQELCS